MSHSDATREKLRAAALRRSPPSPETRAKIGAANKAGENARHWRGGNIGYGAAHNRVRALRGKAYEHSCVDCGVTAAHWSYDHEDENELQSPVGPYSPNPDHYQPRCVRCHHALDERI